MLFLLFAPAAGADPCYDAVMEVHELYTRHYERLPIDRDYFISLARRTRACYADSTSSRAANRHAWLLVRECVALTAERRDSECIEAIDDHIDRFGDVTDRSQMAWLYVRRGESSSMLTRHGDTVANFSEAVRLGEDLDLHHRLDHLLHAGIAYRRLNDHASARRVYEQVMQIASPQTDTNARMARAYARAAYGLSRVKLYYARRGDDRHAYDEGLALLDAAIPLFARYGPQDQLVYVREAQFRYALAREDLDAAAFHLKQAEEAAAGLDDVYVTTGLLTCRADLAWRRGDVSQAIAFAESAVAAVEEIAYYARRRGLYNRLGWWSGAAGDRGAAIGWFWKSIRETEQRRSWLGSSDWSIIAFSELQFPYRNLARLHLSDGDAEQALYILERGRARYLQDARYLSRLRGSMPEDERRRVAEIDEELRTLRARLVLADEADEAYLALQPREYLLTWERSRILRPDTSRAVPQLEEVQRALSRDSRILVTYLLGEDEHPSYAIVVTPAAVRSIRLRTSESEIRDMTERLMGGATEAGRGRIDLGPLHELHLALMDPLLDLIPAGSPVTIVPDGPLQQLPFAMLVSEPPEPHDYKGAQYLVRRNPLSLELSAALILEEADYVRFRHDLLALGRSTFGSDPDPTIGVNLRSSDNLSTNLPNVERELRFLRRVVRNGVFGLNERATAELLVSRMDRSRIIHLATHSTVDGNAGERSFIRLHPGPDSETEEDGTFSIHELQGRYLPAELVVLSACETARGRLFQGEGMTGFQYAFRAAGALSTLATMWAVDDRATRFVIEEFYRNLARGYPRDRALQRAQIAYLNRHDGLAANPFFWAAPVLYGAPDRIVIPSAHMPSLPVRVAAATWVLMSILALAVLHRRRRAPDPVRVGSHL